MTFTLDLSVWNPKNRAESLPDNPCEIDFTPRRGTDPHDDPDDIEINYIKLEEDLRDEEGNLLMESGSEIEEDDIDGDIYNILWKEIEK